MALNPGLSLMVSADSHGVIEYWDMSGNFPKDSLKFKFKTETDLYDIAKVASTDNH